MPTIEEYIAAMYQYRPAQPLSTQVIDLTSANTDKEVPISKDTRFVQAICDGAMNGITIKIQEQSNYAIALDQIHTFPTAGSTRLFLTSDVRSGRSKLTLIFHYIMPGIKANGGQDITLSETAARLGSIHTFDRRGEVIWSDDFQNGVNKWQYNEENLFHTAVTSLHGLFSGKLVNSAAAAWMSYRSLSTFGVEVAFTHDSGATSYGFTVDFYDGTTNYSVSIQYTVATGVLAYLRTPLWIPIATISSLVNSIYLFNIMKITLDLTKMKCKKLYFLNHEYDLSVANIEQGGSSTAPSMRVTLAVSGAKPIYVGHVIVTQNEP